MISQGCIELVKGLLTLNLKMVRGVTISLIVLEVKPNSFLLSFHVNV